MPVKRNGMMRVGSCLAVVSLCLGLLLPTTASAQTPSRIGNWFLYGANMPWLNWNADFGGGPNGGGVSGNLNEVDTKLQAAQNAGMHNVRWWVFEGGSPQIQRDSTGTPTGLNPNVYTDLDAALAEAAKYDIIYDFVLFGSTADDDTTHQWWEDSAKRQALVQVLVPLFQHYANNPRVHTWEIVNEPEWQSRNGITSVDGMLATADAIANAVHQNSPALVTVGNAQMQDMATWVGHPLDYYSPHYYDPFGTDSNDPFVTPANDASPDGKPVVIGEFPAASGEAPDAQTRWQALYDEGYAGGWAWSLSPEHTSDQISTDYTAASAFASGKPDLGPRVSTPATPTPTATLTSTPAPTETPVPTATPTNTPVPTDTPAPTATPTNTPVPTDTPAPTATPTNTPVPTDTPAPTATPTNTPVPTDTPAPTATPTNTPVPTDTPAPTATPTNTALPTNTPTPTAPPTSTPSPTPTQTQVSTPTATATSTSTSVTMPTPGSAQRSLHLDGTTGYAEVRNSNDLNLTRDWTIEAWFKDDDSRGFSHPYHEILNKGDVDASNVPYFARVGMNRLEAGFRSANDVSLITYNLAAAGVSPSAWHHVAVTFDADQHVLNLWLDGKRVRTQQAGPHTRVTNDLPLEIGRSGPSLFGSGRQILVGGNRHCGTADALRPNGINIPRFSPAYWCGNLDNVRIWNVARTDAEITQNYKLRLTGPTRGLVGAWTMDDATATTAPDTSGNHHDATLHGGATLSADIPR